MHPSELKLAFEKGENIISTLKKSQNISENTIEIIETSYDLQTGSYIKLLKDPVMLEAKLKYSKGISDILQELGSFRSIMEVGVGEATTLSLVMKSFDEDVGFHGFDLSWSRIRCAQRWLKEEGLSSRNVSLCTADLFHTPYADSSFDAIYTSYSICDNGGKEKEILTELYRIASRYIVLVEVSYEYAGEQDRERIKDLGYMTNIAGHARELGMKVIRHEEYQYTPNPYKSSPVELTIIEKDPNAALVVPGYQCPLYGTEMIAYTDCYYSEGSMRAYPILAGIPCLRPQSGIIASKYLEFQN